MSIIPLLLILFFIILSSTDFIVRNFFFFFSTILYSCIFLILFHSNYSIFSGYYILIYFSFFLLIFMYLLLFSYAGVDKIKTYIKGGTSVIIRNEFNIQPIILFLFILFYFNSIFLAPDFFLFALILLFFHCFIVLICQIPTVFWFLSTSYLAVFFFLLFGVTFTCVFFLLFLIFCSLCAAFFFFLKKNKFIVLVLKEHNIQRNHLAVDFACFSHLGLVMFSLVILVIVLLPTIKQLLLLGVNDENSLQILLNIFNSFDVYGVSLLSSLCTILLIVRSFIALFCNTHSTIPRYIAAGIAGFYFCSQTTTIIFTGNHWDLTLFSFDNMTSFFGVPSLKALVGVDGFNIQRNIENFGFSGKNQLEHEALLLENKRTGLTPPIKKEIINGTVYEAIASTVDSVVGVNYGLYLDEYNLSQKPGFLSSVFFARPFARSMTFLEYQSYVGLPSDHTAQPVRDLVNLKRLESEMAAFKLDPNQRAVFFTPSGVTKFSEPYLKGRILASEVQQRADSNIRPFKFPTFR